MGIVVRPEAFAPKLLTAAAGVRPRTAMAVVKRRRRWIDSRLAALVVMSGGLAWILAIAGAAFAIRLILVLFVAALAGRTRRLGLPGRAA